MGTGHASARTPLRLLPSWPSAISLPLPYRATVNLAFRNIRLRMESKCACYVLVRSQSISCTSSAADIVAVDGGFGCLSSSVSLFFFYFYTCREAAPSNVSSLSPPTLKRTIAYPYDTYTSPLWYAYILLTAAFRPSYRRTASQCRGSISASAH